jgi:hypothetical protein
MSGPAAVFQILMTTEDWLPSVKAVAGANQNRELEPKPAPIDISSSNEENKIESACYDCLESVHVLLAKVFNRFLYYLYIGVKSDSTLE